MRSWVLTGGLACGKSLASGRIRQQIESCLFFSADQSSAEVLTRGSSLDLLQQRFGDEMVLMDRGSGARHFNRSLLREIVFTDAQQRQWLESWMHPLILSDLEQARAAATEKGVEVFLAEVPLYYEIGSCVPADLVVVVASSPSTQLRRLMEQRGLEESTARRMLHSQLPVAEKVASADVVLWNDGSIAALESQVSTLSQLISDRGRSHPYPSC